MSDGTLQLGSVIPMNRFVAEYDGAALTYGKLKGGKQYAFLFLGIGSPEKPLDVNMALNAMGWCFDPDAADKQYEERTAAKDAPHAD